MLSYLHEREREEMYRTSARSLVFPDGKARRVEAYRLVWSWFDRAIAYEFGPDQREILELTLKCAKEESLGLEEALGRVLNYVIQRDEVGGMDYTDDDLQLLLAKRGMEKFQERKSR